VKVAVGSGVGDGRGVSVGKGVSVRVGVGEASGTAVEASVGWTSMVEELPDELQPETRNKKTIKIIMEICTGKFLFIKDDIPLFLLLLDSI
jgi:hypothetical protein